MEDESKHEILEAISLLAENVQDLSDRTDNGFSIVNSRLGKLESDVSGLKADVGGMKADVGGLKASADSLTFRVIRIEASIVTKSYLDDKLADLRGDLIILARKQNTKLNILVEALVVEGSLPRKVADKILATEPFPELV